MALGLRNAFSAFHWEQLRRGSGSRPLRSYLSTRPPRWPCDRRGVMTIARCRT